MPKPAASGSRPPAKRRAPRAATSRAPRANANSAGLDAAAIRRAMRRRRRVHTNVWNVLTDALDPALMRPKIAADVERTVFETRWGTRYAVIRNPRDNAYLRLSAEEAGLLPLLDGTHTIEEIVVQTFQGSGTLDLDGAVDLVEMLQEASFLDRPWIDAFKAVRERAAPPTARRRRRALAFLKAQTVRFPGAARFVDWVYRHGGRLFFTRPANAVMIAVAVVGAGAYLAIPRAGGRFQIGLDDAVSSAGLLMILDTLTILIHEVGHALAIRHANRKIISAGFQLYLAHPAFFVDSSDMLMAPRRDRIRNAWAGPYSGLVIGGLVSLIVWIAPGMAIAPTLYQLAVLTYFTVLLNLIPFLELDGYWILTDALDMPDLRPRSLAFLRHDLPAKLKAHEKLGRGDWGMFAFGVVGVVFTVLALSTSWFIWKPIFEDLIRGLWRGGILGRAVLFLLAVFVLGPLVHGVALAGRATWRRVKYLAWRIRFLTQTPWRREAGEMIAHLPLLDDIPEEAVNELSGRVELKRVPAGHAIVRRGEHAEAFYIVRRGAVSVVDELPNGGQNVLETLGPGRSFGELALLEGKPRTATVRADEATEVFVIDKGSFDRALAEILKRPALAPSFSTLSEVWSLPPFRELSADEARAVADVGEWVQLGPKTTVVRQGEPGDYFYVVAQGQLEVRERRSLVRVLHAGDFFGEVALLYDVPRTASVRTATPVRLFRLDRKAFRAALLRSFRREAAGTDYARRAMATRKRSSANRRRATTPAKITR